MYNGVKVGYAWERISVFFMLKECELSWSEEVLRKILFSKEFVTISPMCYLKCDLVIGAVVHYLA